ncbi:nibrin isoform 2-T2 [Discoglossus pictus]
MWKLVREGAGETYHFLTGTDYIVGRKNCVILIQDDQSISRAHATLSVTHAVSNLGKPDIIPVLTIKDSSKYGTFINGTKMDNAVPKTVKPGDKVTFGVFNSKFRVEYEPLVACSSCLDNTEKTTLNQTILLLGGHVLNNWTETSTHLVMTSIKVTIKTICALVCCRTIVKPTYFSELIKAIQQKQSLPTITSFIPLLEEPSIKSESLDLSENAKRKSIFQKKVFIFLNNKQFKKLSPAIIFGGGKAIQVKEEMKDMSLLENPSTCVIDLGMADSQLSETESTQSWISSILDFLKSKDLRTIPEAEIGLAVIYVSTEIYCNPERRSASENETGTSNKNVIYGPTLSQSMAVDETILPAALNITAYVANTEPQDQTNTWMDISGVREVIETPKMDRRCTDISSASRVEKDATGSVGNINSALFQEKIRSTEKKNAQLSLLKVAPKKSSQKQQPSNKINNYFQSLAKKRERDEDENEMSFSKSARMEDVSSLCSELSESVLPSPAKGTASQKHGADVATQPIQYSEKPGPSCNYSQGDKAPATTMLEEDPLTKKRKDIDDNFVEESDLESEEDISDSMGHANLKNDLNTLKRRRLDLEKNADTACNTKEEAESTIVKQIPTHDAIKTEVDIKREPDTQREQFKIASEDDGMPSRLLLTEFRSLVVGQPAKHNQVTSHCYQGNGTNFKKFRKVAYPGAGGLPHIIGGSDLIAHDKKKNSELEQWLRQEMEEQTQQAREESLAEDLFRYNPKTVKRRR